MPRYKRLWFQYRVLQRIIGVQDWLFKTKVSDNSDCRLCQEHTESTAHFFSECKFWNDLWENVASWIKSQTKETVIITKNMKILGCLEPCAYFWPLNFILRDIIYLPEHGSLETYIYTICNKKYKTGI